MFGSSPCWQPWLGEGPSQPETPSYVSFVAARFATCDLSKTSLGSGSIVISKLQKGAVKQALQAALPLGQAKASAWPLPGAAEEGKGQAPQHVLPARAA
jgi:hypothetical protein